MTDPSNDPTGDPADDRGPGRYRTLTISIEPELYDDLERRAAREGITLREYLRRGVALNRFIGDHRDRQDRRRGRGWGVCSRAAVPAPGLVRVTLPRWWHRVRLAFLVAFVALSVAGLVTGADALVRGALWLGFVCLFGYLVSRVEVAYAVSPDTPGDATGTGP